jgi:hypothetical protein
MLKVQGRLSANSQSEWYFFRRHGSVRQCTHDGSCWQLLRRHSRQSGCCMKVKNRTGQFIDDVPREGAKRGPYWAYGQVLQRGIRVFCAQPEGTGRISSSPSLLATYGGLLRHAAHASCWMKSVTVAGAK